MFETVAVWLFRFVLLSSYFLCSNRNWVRNRITAVIRIIFSYICMYSTLLLCIPNKSSLNVLFISLILFVYAYFVVASVELQFLIRYDRYRHCLSIFISILKIIQYLYWTYSVDLIFKTKMSCNAFQLSLIYKIFNVGCALPLHNMIQIWIYMKKIIINEIEIKWTKNCVHQAQNRDNQWLVDNVNITIH